LLSRYVDEVILEDAPLAGREKRFDEWLAGRYAAAEMRFDDQFLEEINGALLGDVLVSNSG
jgi:hypothetical protein